MSALEELVGGQVHESPPSFEEDHVVGDDLDALDAVLDDDRGHLEAFLEFVREHKGLYRIISEAEFVANDAFVEHYREFARAYRENLEKAGKRGDIRSGDHETWSWAIMGMAVFLGLRFAEWDDSEPPARISDIIGDLIANGIGVGAGNQGK
jgi:hypothetical protein